MGDDDVICLSSDDDVTQDEVPPKKTKTGPALLAAKIEPMEQRKGTVLCSPKRKSCDVPDEAKCRAVKRSKTDNKDVEEIVVVPAIGAVDKISKPNVMIKEHVGELRLKDQSKLMDNRPLLINPITVKKSSELLEPANKSKPSLLKAPVAPVRNDAQMSPSAGDGSKQFNGRIAESSKPHSSSSTAEDKGIIVVNPVAKLKSRQSSRSPSFATSKTAPATSESDNNDDGKKANGTSSQSKSHAEKPNVVISSKIASNKSANGTRTRTATPTSSVASSKIVDTVENAKVGSAETAAKSRPDRENTPTCKPADSRPTRDSSTSPEILIISAEETPVTSRTAATETAVKPHFSNSSNGTPKSKRETTQTYDHSNSCTPKSSKKFELPRVTDSKVFHDCAKGLFNEAKEVLNGVVKPVAGPSILPTGDSDSPKSLPKSESRDLKTRHKDNGATAKRVSLQRVSNAPSRSKPNSEKSSNDSVSPSSTRSDRRVANVLEKRLSNDSKNSTSESESKSKDREPKPGCSKSPDVLPLKEKSSSATEEKAKKRIADSSQFMDSEPQPGCSKSTDDDDQKPCLVVVGKRPISVQTEDTFSMFISLCLQTDRGPDMEKVVAKLKRYYEELKPEFATSEAFRNTLNEKRDIITQQGKDVVYHYIGVLKKEMKAKKRTAKTAAAENGEDAAEEVNDPEEDPEEARRKRAKIKTVLRAMQKCQKMIKKFEDEDIDFDDESNSVYMKCDRYKAKMVELYTQLCKYTNEHPDAGRAYLRPKHLRVTQIPSVDQAINSFINSKLSAGKKKGAKKGAKGKSFVEGLIFPDYVDILECVEKANKEQELKLDKRAMQNMAEKAFTQLGRHLQEARQSDYWDTFSLHLENSVDPVSSDRSLSEKLAQNKIIAEENEKNVFEEYVRKQEERKAKGYSDSDVEDEEDVEEEEDEEEEEEDEDKKSDRGNESEVAMSGDEDSDRESEGEDKPSEKGKETSEKADKKDTADVLEVIPEVSEVVEDDERPVEDVAKAVSRSNSLEAIEPTADKRVESSESSPGKTAAAIEVTLDDAHAKDDEIVPEREEKFQQPLRIRSFAKPPDSWQCSQEESKEVEEAIEKSEPKPDAPVDNTEDDITVVSYFPGREKITKISTNNGNIAVSTSVTNNANPNATNNGRLSIVKTVTVANSTALNTISGQSPKYLAVAPGVKLPVNIISSSTQNNAQAPKTMKMPHTQEVSLAGNRAVRCFAPVASSTPIQPQIRSVNGAQSVRPRQQVHQLQVRRVGNGGYVTPVVTSHFQNTPRIVTVATTSTPLRLPQLQPQPRFSSVQSVVTPMKLVPTGTLVNGGFNATSVLVGQKNPQQNRVLTPVTLTATQLSNLQHGGNTKYVNRPTSSSENSQAPNAAEQQRKATNNATTVVVPLKVANVVGQTVPSVLKVRMNDNVQTIQLQRGNVVKVTRSGLT